MVSFIQRRNRTGLIVLICLGVLGGWQLLRQREPAYDGKPLSVWLEMIRRATHRGYITDKEAQEAIRQIGTNALPTLLRMMTAKDSAFKTRVSAALPKQWRHWFFPRSADEIQMMGAYGFVALRTIAEPAVPALMELANADDGEVRYHAVYALGHLGAAAQPAIPLLIKRLEDPVEHVRGDAMNGLAGIHLQPDLVVPVLIKYAADPNQNQGLRYTAIQGLGYFGDHAKAAVPTLKRLLFDPDAYVRLAVTNYLPLIEPGTALGSSN
ncbi:MAG TPA: HEAT repeat domain-containing protein [Verrucomicrobiae bacterium]|nr:HEAT repeat domain-containing protein [Verrucomicrobiae bacterium]